MSLLFLDSFELYGDSADLIKKWSSKGGAGAVTTTSTYVRTGLRAYYQPNANDYLLKWIGSDEGTIIYGAGYYINSLVSYSANGFLVSFWENGTNQVAIYNDDAGYLYAYRGLSSGTLLGSTASAVISSASWFFLEVKITFSNTVGTVDVRVNENDVINLTSQDTSNTGNEWTDQFRVGGGQVYYTAIDDVYLLNGSGSTNNDFLGDIKVECIRPTGAGNQTDFTPSTGSNWENVDDITPDDDSTYNYHAPQGLPGTDLFAMGDLTTISGSIFGIQPIMFTRKDDAGSADLYSVIRTNSTDYVGSGVTLGDSYIYHIDILEENPNTATAWTVTDINNIEGGYRRTS